MEPETRVPVTTVPKPLMEKMRSTGRRKKPAAFFSGTEAPTTARAVESVFQHKGWRDPRDWKLLGRVRAHAEFLGKVSEFGQATLGGWLGDRKSTRLNSS